MPERSSAAESGVVIVDKPAGWTSHQVVGRLRRLLGTRKVGHAGTLDPMATGVLLVGVGRATRLLGHLALTDKSYLATIRLGQQTVTDDAEGELVATGDASGLSESDVVAAVGQFRGTISQVPSAVSAIKVNGQRAYARVRRGEDVILAGRTVHISRFDVTGFRRVLLAEGACVDVDVEIDCSSGTYVRALARDVGRDLNVGGHLTRLRRTRVGPFTLELPHAAPADLERDDRPIPLVSMLDVARRCFPVVVVDEAAARDIGVGRPLSLPVPANPSAMVHGDTLIALYRPVDEGSAPVAVLV